MEVRILGGAGLHASEVKAVGKMESSLRNSWYAYAGLVVSDNQGSMEIDTLIITQDRILLVELKEWNGVIQHSNGKWIQNGRPRGTSPYTVKREHARRLAGLLKSELSHKLGYYLHVEAHVVLCGTATPENLSVSEQHFVHTLDDFLKIGSEKGYMELTQKNNVASYFTKTGKNRPNSKESLSIIKEFFSGHRVKPMLLKEGGYIAKKTPWFTHRRRMYQEFEAVHNDSPNIKGLIRRWDFTQLGTENALQNLWVTFALRETRLGRHVRSLSSNLDVYLLRSLKEMDAEDITEDVTELYELHRSYTRLDLFVSKDAASWSVKKRADLVRALITCSSSDLI